MRGAAVALLPCAVASLALAVGCQRDPRTAHAYSLAAPVGWKPWSAGAPPVVPGRVLEAWESPAGPAPGSLVVFRSGYLPETTAEQLLVQTRYLLLNLPGLELKAEKVVEAGGRKAALVEVAAPGSGAALAPTGTGKPVSPTGAPLIPTRRLWLRIPREPELGTLELLFHGSEAEEARLRPAWEAVIASLRA
ncbi:MAG: hypothetical protein HY721_30960 [Planctomycetes bacterium]|nr:hypothetical protein [Planctomycetota bacterium]